MERERGSAAIWAMLLTVVVMILGTAVCYTAYSSRKMTASYEHEVNLRLAAEETLQEAVRRAVADPALLADGATLVVPHEVQSEKGVLIVQAVVAEKRGSYWVVAVAREQERDDWQRHKIARGLLERKGDAYVWKGRSR